MKRRNLILSGLGITGALIVGWGVMPARSRIGKPDTEKDPTDVPYFK